MQTFKIFFNDGRSIEPGVPVNVERIMTDDERQTSGEPAFLCEAVAQGAPMAFEAKASELFVVPA